MVVHSTTKYLNGHSDSVGGIVIAMRDDDIEWLKFIQNAAGAILSPFDSWLVLRGTKTLARAHGAAQPQRAGARGVPGDAPEGEAGALSGPAGSIRSTSWRSGRCAASAACCRSTSGRSTTRAASATACKLMSLAESLGGVETLISHPASMTHASVPPERRAAIGLTDSLVRISAGIEDPQDLIDDLKQALEAVNLLNL